MRPSARGALVTVRDTGSGIAPQEMKRIFDPYWQAETSQRGTGLGHSIAKGIITVAKNGREALDFLQAPGVGPKSTLILLDLVMPVLDGYQFLEERAENGHIARLPVILISGQADTHKAVST